MKTIVTVQIGNKTMMVADKPVGLDVAPVIVNGRAMVPLRAVANACNIPDKDIDWDSATKTVTIIREG